MISAICHANANERGFGLEKKHFLKVFLQLTRSIEVALERGRNRGIRVLIALPPATFHFFLERAPHVPFDPANRRHHGCTRARVEHSTKRAFCTGEHFEKSHARVFVDEAPLERQFGGLAPHRFGQARASFAGHPNRRVEPNTECLFHFTRFDVHHDTTVPLESLAGARQTIREGQRPATERVDGLHVRERCAHLRSIEAGERLHLIPRRVTHVRVLRDLNFDVDRVFGRLDFWERNRNAPLDS